jgi:hypothetical protein
MAKLKKNQLLIFLAALLAFIFGELAKAIGMDAIQAIIVTGPFLLTISGIAFVFRNSFLDDFWLPCLFLGLGCSSFIFADAILRLPIALIMFFGLIASLLKGVAYARE